MLPARFTLLLGACLLLFLAACGSSSNGTSRGTIGLTGGGGNTGGNPPNNPIGGGGGLTGSNNSVVATASVAGIVSVVAGAKQTISITFTSSDGNPISGFGVSGNLAMLPAGWSGPGSFTCASVSTGSGCVLNLLYAPSAADSGTLTIHYVFVNNASVPRTGGSLTIPYVATTHNNVVAAVSPTGQINAVVNSGSQTVAVTFTTDDGRSATALQVTGDLGALPAGWTSASPSFACSSISTGTACRLSLTYAPTVIDRGTLSLTFIYDDNSGNAKPGSVSIPYTAKSPPHLYVADLSGTLYYCSLNGGTVSGCNATGNGLTAPTGIAFSGDFAYVTDYGNNIVNLCNVGLDGSLSGCAPTGMNFQSPWQLAVSGSTLYATNAAPMVGVTSCVIAADGTLSGCTQSSGTGTAGIAVGLNYAYVGVGATTVDVCAVSGSGALTSCNGTTDSGFSALNGITLAGGYVYVANQGNGTVSVCSVNTDGTFSICAASPVGVAPTDLVIQGTQAYVNDASGNVYVCSVGAAGALGSCMISNGGATFNFGIQIAIH